MNREIEEQRVVEWLDDTQDRLLSLREAILAWNEKEERKFRRAMFINNLQMGGLIAVLCLIGLGILTSH